MFRAILRRLKFFGLVIYYKFLTRRGNVLHAHGVHFIGGATGSGKTLLSSVIINRLCDSNNQFFWANINQYDPNNTAIFDFDDIFKDGKLAKRLDNHNCSGLVLDEANLMFNRRINNRQSYNDLFLGLQQLIVAHRHLGIPRVYLIGQHLELQDIQLQRDVRYIHVVANKSRYSYDIYKEKGIIKKRPIKLYVKTYYRTDKSEVIPIKKQKIKISYEELNRYDTLGFMNYFKGLPIKSRNKGS